MRTATYLWCTSSGHVTRDRAITSGTNELKVPGVHFCQRLREYAHSFVVEAAPEMASSMCRADEGGLLLYSTINDETSHNNSRRDDQK